MKRIATAAALMSMVLLVASPASAADTCAKREQKKCVPSSTFTVIDPASVGADPAQMTSGGEVWAWQGYAGTNWTGVPMVQVGTTGSLYPTVGELKVVFVIGEGYGLAPSSTTYYYNSGSIATDYHVTTLSEWVWFGDTAGYTLQPGGTYSGTAYLVWVSGKSVQLLDTVSWSVPSQAP